MNIKQDSKIISLVNIFEPNTKKGRADFYKEVSKWISKYSIKNEHAIIILVGDFNCSVLKDKDRSLNSFNNLQSHFYGQKINQKKWFHLLFKHNAFVIDRKIFSHHPSQM